MAKMKAWVFGLIIGTLLGLWGGINIGKGRPLYANPFSDQSVSGTLQDAGREVIRESGEALEKTGEALKNKAEKSSER